ncbi:hypothetical protein GCM10009841_02970 [Microlunatus panaciterrae]|uniref:Uncharacterized protein n=1 Tax=Microlunatus panaciterrae TaxID=400768 RepID=A0ABS2RKM7_9ACTN|nr:hypothetical protein [Microlunatus panaciterrae]MBM7799042.1 hypothetical protein [Microlunatus panaciterrae]
MVVNRTVARRPPLLVLVQTEATVLMSLAIGQAGLASGFLTGHKSLKGIHEVNAYLIAALTVVTLVSVVLYRRTGGPRWPVTVAGLLMAVELAQIGLGQLDVAGPHIFLGILFVVAATLFTSYLFRPGFQAAP